MSYNILPLITQIAIENTAGPEWIGTLIYYIPMSGESRSQLGISVCQGDFRLYV